MFIGSIADRRAAMDLTASTDIRTTTVLALDPFFVLKQYTLRHHRY
jgi:hypothetical protein